MSRHFENIERLAAKIQPLPFAEDPVCFQRLDTQRKPHALEKARIFYHRHRVAVTNYRAAVAALDCRSVGRVIPMPMGENKQLDVILREMLVGPLRGIEKYVPARRLQ